MQVGNRDDINSNKAELGSELKTSILTGNNKSNAV